MKTIYLGLLLTFLVFSIVDKNWKASFGFAVATLNFFLYIGEVYFHKKTRKLASKNSV
jgi:hypothetical protein